MNVYQSLCVFFSFGFEGGMWDLIILIPDYCLSVCLEYLYFEVLPMILNLIIFTCH